MTKRKSFILHIDSLGILDSLSDEQAGKLFKEIKAYQVDDELTTDEITKLIFFPFKSQFERDEENYKNVCNRNKNNGLKGGRPKASETQKTQSVIKEPKKADSKNDSDSDNKSKSKRFKPPSINDVINYITEKQYSVNANQWMSHYESNGWKVGKNTMKDWKAAVRTWETRSKQDEKTGYRSKANTAAAVGAIFEKEGREAAIRLSEGTNPEVQGDFSSEMGCSVQDRGSSIIEHE